MSSANGTMKGDENGAKGTARARRAKPRGGSHSPPALVRRSGRTAKLGQLRARFELARILGDADEEKASARQLCEELVARDVELDTVIEVAYRALAKHQIPELRHALAAWLEGLGEAALAAAELRKRIGEDPKAKHALLVRIGVLHARAGDALGAQEALVDAAALDENDALPLELLGAVAGWAPEAVTQRSAAEAYVRAARRRAAAGDAEAEREDLFRAFEMDPGSSLAAAALVATYRGAGKDAAADEVLRMHAQALAAAGKQDEASDVHARRRAAAIEASDLARALSSALDEGLDRAFEGEGAERFDDLLTRAGAFEVVAARLEIRAERASGRPGAVMWAELGRLLSGPLAAPERALEAFARSVAADATYADGLHALRSLAQKTGQVAWLHEALVRAALGGAAFGTSADVASRLAGARALATAAAASGDALLENWAHAKVFELDPTDETARAEADRHRASIGRRDEEIEMAQRALVTSADVGRREVLGELARLLQSAPEASAELASVLTELSLVRRDDDELLADALRVAERVSDFGTVAKLCRARLSRPPEPPRVRIALVQALRRAGETGAAGEAARGLLAACTPWAFAVAWVNASDSADAARALALVAPTCTAPVVSAMSAVASERLALAGDDTGARRAAEQACRADRDDVRASRALAETMKPEEGRVAATALERALTTSAMSSTLASRLADTFEQLGETPAALAWARRVVALRPGDPNAVEGLVARAVRAGDAEASSEALSWLLPQPVPAKTLAERIARALRGLAARDTERAAALSRRALDVLGPRDASLRAAISEVAAVAMDPALKAKLIERWLAAGAPAAERSDLLYELARIAEAAGDVDRELTCYVRIARDSGDLLPARERIEALRGKAEGADAELAWYEAHAELRRAEGNMERAAISFRELGAALWDLADDRPRAVSVWLRGAECDETNGYTTLRKDITAFADAQYAVDCLAELVDRESDRARAGAMATEAAHAALQAGAHARALALARTALERDPEHTEVLEIAERASEEMGRVQEMSPLYDQVARLALGRFGRRAAHHRAARFFEAEGASMLALKHAAQAFIAVPSEGTTLGLLERTSDKAQRRTVAVRTVEHVAELSRSSAVRAGWLLRAAALASKDLDGSRQRADLLLKAAVLAPSPNTLGMLATAARDVLSLAPDDAEALALRLERASESLAKELEGPDGARIALTFAELALDLFEDEQWAWRAIENALRADADVDEYVRLLPYAPKLAGAEGAASAIERVFADIEKPYSNVGHACLRLVGRIAGLFGDHARHVRALVRAAEKEPDDDAIVVEADAVVAAHGDAATVEKFSKKIGVFRRAEALRAVARAEVERGKPEAAVPLLERAVAIAPAEARDVLTRELDDVLSRSGRGEETVLRALAVPTLTQEERAERWTELAKIREERGDAAGATDALLQAAGEQSTVERWAAVEKSAETSGRDHIRIEALSKLVDLAPPARRVGFQKRLARAEAARGSLSAAETAWRAVWVADPSDTEADVAIEAVLVARAGYDELATHLATRAERLTRDPDSTEQLRAVRLRRAAILEQRLGRLDDACRELEQVLKESPGHASAMRWLADLYERTGNAARSLAVLEPLLASAKERSEREALAVRQVRSLIAVGEIEKANAVLRDLADSTSAVAVLEARVEVARASGDLVELGAALVDLARTSTEDARARSEMLVEAAQVAARTGDTATSLARAREAATLAPDVASTQLFARGLEYRLHGAGTKDDAAATIASLGRLSVEGLEPEDIGLRAFLLAEAEDIVTPGAGERTLLACVKKVGHQPLVGLGLAERAAAAGRDDEAWKLFSEAVYGNLLGLRRPGRVALAAADCAERAGAADAALRFLNEAALDPETRAKAMRRLGRAALAKGDLARARAILRPLADGASGVERADVLSELAFALFESPEASDRIEADKALREAIDAAPPAMAERLRDRLQTFRSRPPSKPPADSAPTVVPVIAPAPPVVIKMADEPIPSVRHPPLAAPLVPTPNAPLVVQAAPVPSKPEPPATAAAAPAVKDARVDMARAKIAAGDRDEGERLLAEALREGSLEAADELDRLLENDPSRRSLLLKVRRQAVELCPGNLVRLAQLRDVARADHNANYVRAIEHVLRSFDPDNVAPAPAPPLSAQSAQPGMMALLTRHSREAAGEGFGVVWEGATSLFAKPPTAYGMTGLERVVPGPNTSLARLYEVVVRLLDTPRFTLFHRRGRGQLSATVALLSTPAAILSGEAREDGAELRWVLGRALSAVLPENALVLGLPEVDARALWQVLVGAFGPPGAAPFERAHALLADTLWQTLAPRAQRRLKELLTEGATTPFELVLERAKQSGRRVGMFLTGNFLHAARRTVAAYDGFDAEELQRRGGLERLCADLPSLADLYRLAVRPEYADARWHLPTPTSQRPSLAGGVPPV